MSCLYVVATPIGNLEDITLRALRILKEVDFIACEDTRHSKVLLDHYQIEKPLLSYYEATKQKAENKAERIIERIKQGQACALITDAGTPGIADPGAFLIRKAIEEGIKVIPIPGASSLIAALSVSGFFLDRFTFYDFLPKKKGRKTLFERWQGLKKEIVVFFESPKRVERTLDDLVEYLGSEREIVIIREVTKKFEDMFHGTLEQAKAYFTPDKQKGEFVFIVKIDSSSGEGKSRI